MLKKLSFSEKKSIVKSSCSFFKKMQVSNQTLENKAKFYGLDREALNTIVENQPISYFEKMLKIMDVNHRLIIQNDFIEQSKNSSWYENYWSKSTYYKLKHEAIEEFLSFIYV
ncbi:MAG: hypothetical protein E7Y34_01370 [Mycoplasma sp.]|nr:hypothetical protein [Mycoplasma sp.]